MDTPALSITQPAFTSPMKKLLLTLSLFIFIPLQIAYAAPYTGDLPFTIPATINDTLYNDVVVYPHGNTHYAIYFAGTPEYNTAGGCGLDEQFVNCLGFSSSQFVVYDVQTGNEVPHPGVAYMDVENAVLTSDIISNYPIDIKPDGGQLTPTTPQNWLQAEYNMQLSITDFLPFTDILQTNGGIIFFIAISALALTSLISWAAKISVERAIAKDPVYQRADRAIAESRRLRGE